jgi:mono/diheme cytochrome c family protein
MIRTSNGARRLTGSALALALVAFGFSQAEVRAGAAPSGYGTACQSCHKADGSGVPGVFPRISGRLGSAAQSAEGRKWLIATVLFGQSGEIKVDGKPIRGAMPGFARLSDAQIAETLTWLSGGSGKPFTAAEVAAVRTQGGLNGAKVGQMRAKLAGAGAIK